MKVQALSDRELRIKVAELCGYEYHTHHKRWRLGDLGPTYPVRSLPHYERDLNAMHEAEEMLAAWYTGVHPSDEDFLHNLIKVVATEGKHRMAHHATARQRAEAFVMTLEGE